MISPIIANQSGIAVVKTPGYGTLGLPVNVMVNCFKVNLPTSVIYHYDVAILPPDATLSAKAKINIFRGMQDQNPTIFTKRGSYDGRKNFFSLIKYPFGDSAKFDVNDPIKPNRWRVLIQKIDTIDPQAASRYIEGKPYHQEGALTTVTACNVTIQARPLQDHLFHRQAFFSRAEFQDIGRGLEVWRGYFQSLRPMVGKMVITLDTRSVAVYKPGPLINVCLAYLERSPEAHPARFLNANVLNESDRKGLARYLRNLKVRSTRIDTSMAHTIKNVSVNGADTLLLKTEDREISVAAYYSQVAGYQLRYPSLICVQFSSKTWFPLECCEVIPGQVFPKKMEPDQANRMGRFSSLTPKDCLQSIRDGLQVLGYSSNKCLQEFGMNVDPDPMTIKGRILPPPTLVYGRNEPIIPRDGRWNIRYTALYRPARIEGCAIIIYDERFTPDEMHHLKQSLLYATNTLQLQGMPPNPPVLRKSAMDSATLNHIREAAMMHKSARGNMPNLIIVVLPDTVGRDIYLRVKKAGDINIGVATQCLRASKCRKGNSQYFNSACLKINVKLGGINYIPMTRTLPFLKDAAHSTLVVGADIKYGRQGRSSRPSYAAIVGNVDSDLSKYVAISKPQDCRVETIQDLADMISDVIKKFMNYREVVEKSVNLAPERILFYRNSNPEEESETLKNSEIAEIFKACDRLGIPRPKLTFIVVDKHHRIRFFPSPGGYCDRSGNVPAGLVIDSEITGPVEYDFYLQSHRTEPGTSRPAHYNVLLDQNNLMPDHLQRLSFALCHIHARSTYATSVVAPILYASAACVRARNYSNPKSDPDDTSNSNLQAPTAASASQLKASRREFQPVHPNTGRQMYFL